MRGFEAVGHLGCRVGEHLGIRVGRRAGLVARVGEQVGRTPQQPHSSTLPGARAASVDHLIELGRRFGELLALGGDVAIVEAVERHAQLGEELERGVHLLPRRGHRIGVAANVGCHGRSNVPAPKMSKPSQAKLCQ